MRREATQAGETIDIELLRTWIGRETLSEDTLTVRHARLMAATLGQRQDRFDIGTPLPPLWHWLYFLEGAPPNELGRDGHPARGGFLPPVPLSNRMWAGGRVDFHAPITLGTKVLKRSTVTSVEQKQGRSGTLVFVTVQHEIIDAGKVAITEEHDIVYKQPPPPGQSIPRAASADMPPPAHSELFEPTSTQLFRYSALTFNGHRIHYDVDYCRNVEGYSDLVVHGPLQATLLADLANRTGGAIRHFSYRGVQPSMLGTPLTVNAAPGADRLTLWTAQADGTVSMRAEALFAQS
jgi:3-methylfumaryl-CoA hydratase